MFLKNFLGILGTISKFPAIPGLGKVREFAIQEHSLLAHRNENNLFFKKKGG